MKIKNLKIRASALLLAGTITLSSLALTGCTKKQNEEQSKEQITTTTEEQRNATYKIATIDNTVEEDNQYVILAYNKETNSVCLLDDKVYNSRKEENQYIILSYNEETNSVCLLDDKVYNSRKEAEEYINYLLNQEVASPGDELLAIGILGLSCVLSMLACCLPGMIIKKLSKRPHPIDEVAAKPIQFK